MTAAVDSPRWQGRALVAVQLALPAVIGLVSGGDAWDVPTGLRTAGDVVRIVGLAAIVWGGLRLGAAVSVHPEPTARAELRVDGPYQCVRHPISTGVLVGRSRR